MVSRSRTLFSRCLPAITACACLVSVSCFAQTTFLAVDRTPYDKQMTPVSLILNASSSPRPSQTSLAVLNRWMSQLRAIPYRYSGRWKTPDEMASAKRADCKGKAVALYEKMRANGAHHVRLIIGKRQASASRTHAWVEWDTRQGTFLLDPTLNWTATKSELQDKSTYIPLYAYENGHKYRAFNPTLIASRTFFSHQVASRE